MPSVHPKRQRVETSATSTAITKSKNGLAATVTKPNHSRILAPFRSIGHTTSPVPFSLLPQGKTFQITTALERTVQTYDVRKINLLFVSSPPTPGLISHVVAHKDVVYTAFTEADGTTGVWIFKRGKKCGELERLERNWGAWRELIVFGQWVVGAFNKALVVWRREGGEVYTELEIGGGGAGGEVVAMCHPSAYLNKVVVGRRNGDVEIWNVKTGKNIYTILSPLPFSSSSGAITTIIQSPVISIIAIGYSTGEIHLHNILTDMPLFTLNRTILAASAHTKRATSLSFCTDPFVGAGQSKTDEGAGRILAVGHDDGYVTLWNLEKRKIFGEIRNAHESSAQGVCVEWLTGQNILLTSASDNSIKEWIFDSPHTARPRLQTTRSGHSSSISALSFVSPGTSHFLLSASRDRSLRGQSLRNDSQSFEFSQGTAVKKAKKEAAKLGTHSLVDAIEQAKAGPITCIATCAGDDGAGSAGRDWEGIITGHQDERAARTWSFRNKNIGRWALETSDGGEVKSVAISACGSFGIIGSSKGGIDMYNLQSGLHRRKFPDPLTPAQARLVKKGEATGKLAMIGRGKHTKAVTGLITDALNRVVISCGLDGRIKFWEFLTGILIYEFDWSDTTKIPNRLKFHRNSELLALACDDTCIRIIDVETKKVVRELWGCEGKISDFCFSGDGRWVVAASMDSCVRIWDLPTGHLIDAMRTATIVSALAFSGGGDFLATAHVGSVGISLWTNRTLFRHVPTRNINDRDIVDLSMPTISGVGGTSTIEGALLAAVDAEGEDDDDDDEAATGVYTTADQLSDSLLTMSLVPRTRWQTLLNLDAIRARNKPTEAPKPPEKAPFFLPTLTNPADIAAGFTLDTTAGATAAANKEAAEEEAAATAAERNRIMRFDPHAASGGESAFNLALHSGDSNSNSNSAGSKLVDILKTLPPSSADLEIRYLSTEAEMVTFVKALTNRLRQRRDFELVQTWMTVFLRVHGGDVINGLDESLQIENAWLGINDNEEKEKEEEEEEGKVESGVKLREALEKWRAIQRVETGRLSNRVGFCLGVAEFLRSGR